MGLPERLAVTDEARCLSRSRTVTSLRPQESQNHLHKHPRFSVVDQVPDWNGEDAPLRNTTGQLDDARLGNMTFWPTSHNKGFRGDLTEALQPLRIRRVNLPPDSQHHLPVKRQHPIRPGRSGLLPGSWNRNVLQDEPVHALRILLGEQIGNNPTHRVPNQIHPVKTQRIQKTEYIVPHQLQRVVPRPIAPAMAAKIKGIDPPTAGEAVRHDVPVRSILAQRMQQDERRSIRRSRDLIGQPDTSNVNRAVISHARNIEGDRRHRRDVHQRPNRPPSAP
jgi:hypothetical protein